MSILTMHAGRVLSALDSSEDLAIVLNSPPATPEDAEETPLDWLDGIWVAGTVYPLDREATTATLAVLAHGGAAVTYSPHGTYCRHEHGPASSNVSFSGHWCPADTASWADGEARGVMRDWRSVYVWDTNGFTDTTVYPTLDEAKAAFDREVAELERMREEYAREQS